MSEYEHVEGVNANEAAATPLVPVEVDGWQLFSDGERDWIEDIELAARAGLAKPRNIRSVVRGVLRDGGVALVGPAAEEILGGLGSALGAGATKSRAKHATSDADPSKSPNQNGALAAGAVIRAEKVVLSKGDRGGSQETVQFFLNHEAALRVIMRLRTPKAVELQILVGRVFLLAEQGRLPPSASRASSHNARREVLAATVRLLETALHAGDAEGARVANEALARLLRQDGDVDIAHDTDALTIGEAAAKVHVLDPLNEVARILARSIGQGDDTNVLRSIRLSCDRQLRRELGFALDGGQSWAAFPRTWLDHAQCVVRRMLAEAKGMARLSGLGKDTDGAETSSSGAMEQVDLRVVR